MTRRDLPLRSCLVVFAVVWGALAIAPIDRATWALENIPTLFALPVLCALYRRKRLSNRSYVQITVFLVLHTIGSHYTYSQVPLGNWAQEALGLSRNHYDRLVHFTFGALLFLPNFELAFGLERTKWRFVENYLAFTAVAWWSLFYELLEWWTAVVVDPAAGTAFLGTQGDQWDSQMDAGLACAGAVVASGLEVLRWLAKVRSESPIREGSGPTRPPLDVIAAPGLPERLSRSRVGS